MALLLGRLFGRNGDDGGDEDDFSVGNSGGCPVDTVNGNCSGNASGTGTGTMVVNADTFDGVDRKSVV